MSVSSADELEFYDAPELAEEQEEKEKAEGVGEGGQREEGSATSTQVNHGIAEAEDEEELVEAVESHPVETSLTDRLEKTIDETIEEALFNGHSELEGSGNPAANEDEADNKREIGESIPAMKEEDNRKEPNIDRKINNQTVEPPPSFVEAPVGVSGLVESLTVAMDKVVGEAMLNESSPSAPLSLESSTMDLVSGEDTAEEEALIKAFDDKLSFEEHRSQARLNRHTGAKQEEQLSKERALKGLEQLARRTSSSAPDAEGTSPVSPLSSSFWGALSSFKERIYDALDPNMLEGEKIDDNRREGMTEKPLMNQAGQSSGDKSIKSLLERLSPGGGEPTASSGGNGGWMDDFDRTFDFASDKIGQVLLGGLKTLETTVGISIEPISSPSPSPSPSASEGERGREPERTRTGTKERKETTDIGGRDDGYPGDTDSTIKTPISSSSSLLYSAGLGTLERLGRTTAGLVVSTKERLTPILRQGLGTSEAGERLTRQDLKRPWEELFDELSGNQVLERLQVVSAEAATELRRALKALPSKQLTIIQGQLRGIGCQLDSLREAPEVDWASLTGSPLVVRGQEELLERLQRSIQTSLGRIADPEAAVVELRSRLADGAHALSADGPSLLLYMARSNLANLISASLHVLLCLHPRAMEEEQLMRLVMGLYGAVSQMQTLVSSPPASLVDANRKAALCKLIADDCAAARTLFGDAALMLQPMLKWDKYQEIRDATRDRKP